MKHLSVILSVLVCTTTVAFAQTGTPAPLSTPAPQPSGGARMIIRATRLTEPMKVDGRLDEAVYTAVAPSSGFVQNEPMAGAPANERTDVWVTFDDNAVYVTIRAWESEPDRLIAKEMRRDSTNITQNDSVAFVLDTFNDRRNGVVFTVTPIGGRMDGQISNEGNYNGDWNPVWDLAVGRFDGGWIAEAAVPFKSLRYAVGAPEWGFNARRISRWRNEVSYLSPVPNGAGTDGLYRVSRAATVTGLSTPRVRNLDVKPFVTSDLKSDVSARPPVSNDLGADGGLDVKVGLTQGLTADLTYRTDFAQVEADEQQVNLTRFSLFFPEKREFFLENQGIFQFGGAAGRGAVPFAFYSRRIGLDQGREVPLEGGGRLTGRVGRYSIGLIDVQTDATSATRPTNFTVARVKRDILRKSSIGLMYTRRSVSTLGTGSNELFGADARFAWFQNLTVDTYLAMTRTAGVKGDDGSYRVQMQYNGDRYGLTLHRLYVGQQFNPEVGFIYRDDVKKYFWQARFSPRPRRIRGVRKFSYQVQVDHFDTASTGELETRQAQGTFSTEFQNSDKFTLTVDDYFERLDQPFAIAKGVTIPIGGHNYRNVRAEYAGGQQRPLSGTVFVERGSFWDGDKTTFGVSSGLARLTPRLSVEPALSVNRVELPYGAFTTKLVSSRATFTLTPLMFVSGLVQYNSSANQLSTNVRLRWEYQPGSELFVVYNEGRDTRGTGFPTFQNRALIVKLNRLFRL